MLGGIISAGSSLLGGLFGRRNEQKMAKQSSGWALRDTVNTARELGIHGLSALGTVSPYGSQNPMAAGVAAAGQEIGQSVASKNSEKIQRRLTDSQIKVNDMQAKLLEAQSRSVANERFAAARGGTIGSRNIADPRDIAGRDMGGDLAFGGPVAQTSPKFSDAEHVEKRYGDVVSALYGMYALGGDIGHNARKAVKRHLNAKTDDPKTALKILQDRRKQGEKERSERELQNLRENLSNLLKDATK